MTCVSGADRSCKIQDANEMVAEGAKKGPELTQSRSLAATSVNSSMKYFLSLGLGGHCPEKLGRKGKDLKWREIRAGALWLEKGSTLKRNQS